MKCRNCDADATVTPVVRKNKGTAHKAKCPNGHSYWLRKGEMEHAPPKKENDPAPEPAPAPEPKKNQPTGRSIADDIIDGIRNWIRS